MVRVLLVTSRLQDLAQVIVAARDSLQMRVADTPGVLNFAGFHRVEVANH